MSASPQLPPWQACPARWRRWCSAANHAAAALVNGLHALSNPALMALRLPTAQTLPLALPMAPPLLQFQPPRECPRSQQAPGNLHSPPPRTAAPVQNARAKAWLTSAFPPFRKACHTPAFTAALCVFLLLAACPAADARPRNNSGRPPRPPRLPPEPAAGTPATPAAAAAADPSPTPVACPDLVCSPALTPNTLAASTDVVPELPHSDHSDLLLLLHPPRLHLPGLLMFGRRVLSARFLG